MEDVLLNETNFCYSFPISEFTTTFLNYNFNKLTDSEMDGERSTEMNRLVINRNHLNENQRPFELDTKFKNDDEKFRILFTRYKKMFLVMKNSLNPPKNLKPKDYQEIAKYL
jgi:hypothetical protein